MSNIELLSFELSRGGNGSGVPESTTDPECRSRQRIRSAGVDSGRILNFFRTQSRSKKFVKNWAWIRNHFLLLTAAGVFVAFCKCHCICIVQTLLNFGCMNVCRNSNMSRILKLENISEPAPHSKILEQERSRSLKL